jgi:tellurite resistance protein TerC
MPTTPLSRAATYVDLDITPLAWAVLGVSIAALIAVDLWRHRDDHEPTTRGAVIETVLYVAAGVLFGVGVWAAYGAGAAGEYFSGYVIEKSLSVDNVFVWALLFTSFAIPVKYQHRVLFWGIFGALVLRGVFIVAGAALITRFWVTLVVFGLILIWSGIKVLRHNDNEGDEGHSRASALLGRFIPVVDRFDGHKFFTVENGRRAATPLLAALVAVEVTDVIFAVDSVPAILAVSREEYIVFASNAFAILGLRAMYFLLAGAKDKVHYLSHALGAILVFVGIKMTISHWWHMPTWISLTVIFALLAAAITASIMRNRRASNHSSDSQHDGANH